MSRGKSPGMMTILLILLSQASAWAGPLDTARATAFLQGLIDHPDSMETFIDGDDLEFAGRLGIGYPEAPSKPLISWDLSGPDRERLVQEGIEGSFAIEPVEDRHDRLVLFPATGPAAKSWIFKNGRLVSSILYQVRRWHRIESPHFRFFVSDTTLFHLANIEALESFLTATAAELGLTAADLDRLEQQKIIYCFCSTEEEIRALTGYAARGMYIVSHDIIVSTFSAHFHELAHLLMNYKLRRPHLYTHPFFLEGFAVAVGGRGGKAPGILHELGRSILRSGWVTLDELLDAQGFYRQNASMSYPASGLANRFLLDSLEAADYLDLYARYGGPAQEVLTMRIDRTELPNEAAWQGYLADPVPAGWIRPGAPAISAADEPRAFQNLPGETAFSFAVPGTTLVFYGPPAEGYRSFLYEDFFDDGSYAGQRIFIRASAVEVAVYDLFTNTMLALYASGFSDDGAEIPVDDGRYLFEVDGRIFPGVEGRIEYR